MKLLPIEVQIIHVSNKHHCPMNTNGRQRTVIKHWGGVRQLPIYSNQVDEQNGSAGICEGVALPLFAWSWTECGQDVCLLLGLVC